jgi:hypothetical protein
VIIDVIRAAFGVIQGTLRRIQFELGLYWGKTDP